RNLIATLFPKAMCDACTTTPIPPWPSTRSITYLPRSCSPTCTGAPEPSIVTRTVTSPLFRVEAKASAPELIGRTPRVSVVRGRCVGRDAVRRQVVPLSQSFTCFRRKWSIGRSLGRLHRFRYPKTTLVERTICPLEPAEQRPREPQRPQEHEGAPHPNAGRKDPSMGQ